MPQRTPEQIENLKKWVAALRSGDYKQGRRKLSCNERYCCLGVAREILKENFCNTIKKEKDFLLDSQEFENTFGINHDEHAQRALSSTNDNGAEFTEIADYIESEYINK